MPNTSIVEKVIFGAGGIVEGAKSGLTVVDPSTITYMGTLSIMFGGDEALFQEVHPSSRPSATPSSTWARWEPGS